jgi:hydroxymethylbilane synthase
MSKRSATRRFALRRDAAERADPRDRLVVREGNRPRQSPTLPQGARLGTSSRRGARRRSSGSGRIWKPCCYAAMSRRGWPKLRGGRGRCHLLAAAGLDRLGMHDVGHFVQAMRDAASCAASQGAIGIEIRADDSRARTLIAVIDDPQSHACILAERALLAALKADCHSPVAALATLEGAILTIEAELLSEDGSAHVHGQIEGAPLDPDLPAALARDLLDRAPDSVRRLFEG